MSDIRLQIWQNNNRDDGDMEYVGTFRWWEGLARIADYPEGWELHILTLPAEDHQP